MATTEQRDKRVATKRKALDAAEPKLVKLDEKVANFDERMKELREKLIGRHERAKATVSTLRGEIEWLQAMPIDGQVDATLDEPDGDETDQGDEPDPEGEAADATAAENGETARQRDERGHFVSQS